MFDDIAKTSHHIEFMNTINASTHLALKRWNINEPKKVAEHKPMYTRELKYAISSLLKFSSCEICKRAPGITPVS